MRTTRSTPVFRFRAMAEFLLALALLMALVVAAQGCDAQDRAGLTGSQLSTMIEELLPGIAEASGLAVRRPVQYELQSRRDARSFIERQLDEELGPDELAGLERAYRTFGLFPDTLRLRDLLLELLTEQVVGYYDPATDRLYVVEGVAAATASPVVAHELVHALQDQHTDLDSLMAPERGNDRQTAAQAAAEGHAMLVMIALQAAESSGEPMDLGALPDLGAMMQPILEAENQRFPVFQRSPRVIRETLIFPYIGGASFVQALYRHRQPGETPPVPFGDLLPQSTEQVIEPERAFFGERDAPTEIELSEPGEAGWSVVYSNTLGQLETGILLSERAGVATGPATPDQATPDPATPAPGHAASGWDGDRYALLDGPDGRRALVWYSVWDDPAAADRVANALAAVADWTVDRIVVAGRPVVRLVITGEGAQPSGPELPVIAALQEIHRR